jgi:DMSO/TMAO reductase YedYZ molybdopterin-dependent catalytic subunit
MARLIFEMWRMRRMNKVDPAVVARIPPGQTLTAKWPVLTYGVTPRVDRSRWTFRCFGLVEQEVTWTWAEVLALPRASIISDVHCVTRWSKLDNEWEGVPIREIMSRIRLKPAAKYVMVHADPDYTTNLAVEDLVQDDVLLALRHGGRDLEPEHGGPCRLVVPRLYFWKSAKWVRAFEFLDVNAPGFWEQNGYHMHADPWKDERYSDQETHAMQTMRAQAARALRERR